MARANLTSRAVGDLTAAGWSPEDISDALGVHLSTVYRYINKSADIAANIEAARARRRALVARLDPEGIRS